MSDDVVDTIGLKEIMCPDCGTEGAVHIIMMARFHLDDGVVDLVGDRPLLAPTKSGCSCPECAYAGKLEEWIDAWKAACMPLPPRDAIEKAANSVLQSKAATVLADVCQHLAGGLPIDETAMCRIHQHVRALVSAGEACDRQIAAPDAMNEDMSANRFDDHLSRLPRESLEAALAKLWQWTRTDDEGCYDDEKELGGADTVAYLLETLGELANQIVGDPRSLNDNEALRKAETLLSKAGDLIGVVERSLAKRLQEDDVRKLAFHESVWAVHPVQRDGSGDREITGVELSTPGDQVYLTLYPGEDAVYSMELEVRLTVATRTLDALEKLPPLSPQMRPPMRNLPPYSSSKGTKPKS